MSIPFPAPNGGFILGQPFTVSNVSIPISAIICCNCAVPPSQLQIVASAPVVCPACQKTYTVALDPKNGQLTVAIAVPDQKDPL
jgi:hypothetical protein